MNDWQICGLIVLAWANGVFFGWIRWRKPQLDEAIRKGNTNAN
jgi:hypothetical protein